MSSGDHGDNRREYQAGRLSREGLPDEPLELFDRWLADAVDAEAKDATAMAVATVAADGVPSVRIVLLKSHGPDGFTFFTDTRSQKGRELAENPVASAVFYWRDFDRQVRLTGAVSRVDDETAQVYFQSRPEDSRFSAAASFQSSPITDRQTLEDKVAALRAAHPDGNVPKPLEWGGYRLLPHTLEFWQGREGRLHDRFRYRLVGSGWEIERLQP
jgi:pyridoxamine 5'-phosphate oxidase